MRHYPTRLSVTYFPSDSKHIEIRDSMLIELRGPARRTHHSLLIKAASLHDTRNFVSEIIEILAGSGIEQDYLEGSVRLDLTRSLANAHPMWANEVVEQTHSHKAVSPDDSAAVRAERTITAAARLLPAALRDRQVCEWLDHLHCEREAGRDERRALRSILLRSVAPIALGARTRNLARVLARPR